MEEENLKLIEETLDEILPKTTERPSRLYEAMRYAVGTGGKRLRPLICLAAAEAVGGTCEDAKYPAAAIELLHNYTLVHDDLPAMDNDTERRGQPSVWAKYGEAVAILAADALLSLSYRALAYAPRNIRQLVEALGEKGVGVVAGQIEDIARTGDVAFIYEHKTADLFMAAAVMGGWAGGGSVDDIEALRDFAKNLGFAFQYQDDILDGDSPWPVGETERRAAAATSDALAALDRIPGDTSRLRRIAFRLVGRKK